MPHVIRIRVLDNGVNISFRGKQNCSARHRIIQKPCTPIRLGDAPIDMQ
jgi:hypothetical protein